MSDIAKWTIGVLAVAAVLIGLDYGYNEYDLAKQKRFAPQYQQVQTDVFKQSQAYNDGMMQQLEARRIEYASGDPDVKQAIASWTYHNFAAYDKTKLSPDDRAFVAKMTSVSSGGPQ